MVDFSKKGIDCPGTEEHEQGWGRGLSNPYLERTIIRAALGISVAETNGHSVKATLTLIIPSLA